MHSELKTPFWKAAYASLPPGARSHYHADLVAAERWELAIDAVVDGWSGAKIALARMFQTPRARHGH